MRTTIIAEIGPNHNGSPELAFELVRQLAQTDVDVIKFQLAVPENVYSRDAFKANYQKANDGDDPVIEMSRRNQLSREVHLALAEACRAAGKRYACTGFDLDSLIYLDTHMDLPFFKVGSGELLTLDMLEYMAGRQRPILLSTGMASFHEIQSALDVLDRPGPADVSLLHCVSQYPTPPSDVNLRTMTALAERFGRPVGYSDHCLGPECCLAAISLGASVIEKHVTLDRTLPGPDHQASADMAEFDSMIRSIRLIETALGSADKTVSPAEDAIRRMARKSVVSTRALEPGHVLTAGDLCFKRPGTGLSPMERDRIIGRRLARAMEADRVLTAEDLD